LCPGCPVGKPIFLPVRCAISAAVEPVFWLHDHLPVASDDASSAVVEAEEWASHFQITPRKGSTGLTLFSEVLPYPLWYARLDDAIAYARWWSRVNGCRIEVMDGTGGLVDVMEFEPSTSHVY